MTKKMFIVFLLSLSVSGFALPMMEGEEDLFSPEGLPSLTLPLSELASDSSRPLPVPVDPKAPVVYTRTVQASIGQNIEIPFGGNGWVFLGEEKGQKGLSYISHRFDPEGQSFLFSADQTGTYGLSFYKQDFIRDLLLRDHVKVIVQDAGAEAKPKRGAVVAQPRWPTAAQEAALATGDTVPALPQSQDAKPPEEAPGTIPVVSAPPEQAATPAPAPTEPDKSSPEEYAVGAKKALDVGDIASALALLDELREQYPVGTDEAWWLYAQAFEAKGPAKDMKSARHYYQRLVNEFPLSPHWREAQDRIKYLDRYYFNIQ